MLKRSLALRVARSAVFDELLIQPGRLETACAFAPRLAVWTRLGLAGDLGTQRLADTLRLGSFACLADAHAEVLGCDALSPNFLDHLLND